MRFDEPARIAEELRAKREGTLAELEAVLDDFRRDGQYKQAGQAQLQLETVKSQEREQQLQALSVRHGEELHELQTANMQGYNTATQRWDLELAALNRSVSLQETTLANKHQAELDALRASCSAEPLRFKCSKSLLDLRVKEEHCLKLRAFKVAAKVKSGGDVLEAQEIEAATHVQKTRQQAELNKLLGSQLREQDAQGIRLRALQEERVIAQGRELELLRLRMQASGRATQRNQAQERSYLETALRGWLNPRKLGLPPPPLQLLHGLTPGQRVATSRPGTAPAQQFQTGHLITGTRSASTSLSSPAAQRSGSPNNRTVNARNAHKPWGTDCYHRASTELSSLSSSTSRTAHPPPPHSTTQRRPPSPETHAKTRAHTLGTLPLDPAAQRKAAHRPSSNGIAEGHPPLAEIARGRDVGTHGLWGPTDRPLYITSPTPIWGGPQLRPATSQAHNRPAQNHPNGQHGLHNIQNRQNRQNRQPGLHIALQPKVRGAAVAARPVTSQGGQRLVPEAHPGALPTTATSNSSSTSNSTYPTPYLYEPRAGALTKAALLQHINNIHGAVPGMSQIPAIVA